MKSCYTIKLGLVSGAIADLVKYYNCGWYITRLNVPPQFRGKGHGRKLLKLITDAADKEGAVLFLEIQPGDNDGLTYDQLRDWYERAGFKQDGIFMRKPKK